MNIFPADDSDLNLAISKEDFCSAKAMSHAGFGFMWAGARATYGATRGRVCYEVRIDSNCDTRHLEEEANPNVLRCGWSVQTSSLQLGEDAFSYGYGGTAKASAGCKFFDYGIAFGVGDVVGCYLVSSHMNWPSIFTFKIFFYCAGSWGESNRNPFHCQWPRSRSGLPYHSSRPSRASTLSTHPDQEPKLHGQLWPTSRSADDAPPKLLVDRPIGRHRWPCAWSPPSAVEVSIGGKISTNLIL